MPPSSLLGLTPGSLEAYCFDEAVWYFGTVVTNELDEASQPKKSKGSSKAQAARQRVLDKYLKGSGAKDAKGQYADPMALMK